MVAPNYAAQRSALAKSSGFGQTRRKAGRSAQGPTLAEDSRVGGELSSPRCTGRDGNSETGRRPGDASATGLAATFPSSQRFAPRSHYFDRVPRRPPFVQLIARKIAWPVLPTGLIRGGDRIPAVQGLRARHDRPAENPTALGGQGMWAYLSRPVARSKITSWTASRPSSGFLAGAEVNVRMLPAILLNRTCSVPLHASFQLMSTRWITRSGCAVGRTACAFAADAERRGRLRLKSSLPHRALANVGFPCDG